MNKIVKYFNAYKEQKKLELAYLKELNWANIYHDSIRGKKEIEELPLNIGRWAGNYAFFYVLHTVLSKANPNNILELGLGESTKFISTYLKNYLPQTKHVVIEHDESWISFFNSSFELNSNSKIVHAEIENRKVNGLETISYVVDDQLKNSNFDLYVIDGPYGSKRFSRFNIVDFADSIKNEDNFIIVFDDYHRDGEKETIKVLLEKFDNKKVNCKINVFKGIKDVCLIVSENNNFLASI
jgi:hypothetical protein